MNSLAIGVNIFECPQWNECKNNLLSIKPRVSLCCVQFCDDIVDSTGFWRCDCLKTRAKNIIPGSVSEKPIIYEMFDGLASAGLDYFLFINCDIIVSEKAIDWMLNQDEYHSACFFRTKHGVDGFYINTMWWKLNRTKFFDLPNVYAEPAWDAAYAAKLKAESKCFFHNKEYLISHIKHEQRWQRKTLEGDWCTKKFYKSGLNPIWRSICQNA